MLTNEQAGDLPVTAEVDVLVVGGGPAGIGAALGAARTGARTLVVEQHNCLGGVAGAGAHGHISKYDEQGTGRQIVAGVAEELRAALVEAGLGHRTDHGVWFQVEGLKLLLERMMDEAGVALLYHTFFCDTLVADGAVCGAVVQNKTGRSLIRARRVIDCTGDGDVAFHAGCPFEIGRPADGRCQPVTLMFTIGGVQWDRVEAWRNSVPPDKRFQRQDVWLEAQANGDMRPFQTTIMGWWHTPSRPDWVNVNFTHVIHVDSTQAEDLTRATIEARRQAWETVDVYRKYVPGMEACYLVDTAATIGLRESRRIGGDYVLNDDDIRSQATFDDSIGYGSFFVDIHCIDGPGMDPTTWRPPKGFKYQIPYRILLPRGVDNLMTAGRCVSTTHVALGSLRVMVPCIQMGQAAGIASAMSLCQGVAPRDLNVPALQEAITRAGGIVAEEDIVRYNASRTA